MSKRIRRRPEKIGLRTILFEENSKPKDQFLRDSRTYGGDFCISFAVVESKLITRCMIYA